MQKNKIYPKTDNPADSQNSKDKLFGKTLDELITVAEKTGGKPYMAKQMAEWLYGKSVRSIDEMTNLSKEIRKQLSVEYEIGLTEPSGEAASSDGTKKYTFKVLNSRYIETAYIPDEKRATICLSTQAGCKMGCIFCMTGKQGFQGHLSTNEILNQFRSLPEFTTLTNIVYMGMGEPLNNLGAVLKSLEILTSSWGYGWSPTRITVSTVGLTQGIKHFLERSRCHLAVSLHSPFDEEREYLMPVQKSNKIQDVLEVIKKADINSQRRVSFEYIVFKGLNDTKKHINALARILNGIKCRINLIRFHAVPGLPFASPDNKEMIMFKEALNKKGILTTIRASRGEDIQAACGLLSTLEQNKQ